MVDSWCKVIVIAVLAALAGMALIGPGIIADSLAVHDWLTIAGYAVVYTAAVVEAALAYTICKRGARICTS